MKMLRMFKIQKMLITKSIYLMINKMNHLLNIIHISVIITLIYLHIYMKKQNQLQLW